MMKDTSNAVPLDEAVEPGSPLVIEVADYVELAVHNEKSDNKDYEKFLIISPDGTKYVTGSESFKTAFVDIYNEMIEAGESMPYSVEARKLESKNYKGKYFLSCSII
ncbi:MAG: hypothetical protein MJ237_08315 [bacterium]|nr:hypothetical protein [bacterium]